MKRFFLPLLVASAVVVGAGYLAGRCHYALAQCPNPIKSPESTSAKSQVLGPRYVTYSAAALAQAQADNQKTVLYFWAPWCVTCSSLDDELQQAQDILPPDVTVLRVAYDSEKTLKKQYDVVAQHTLVVVDASGKVLKTWVGGDGTYLREQLSQL